MLGLFGLMNSATHDTGLYLLRLPMTNAFSRTEYWCVLGSGLLWWILIHDSPAKWINRVSTQICPKHYRDLGCVWNTVQLQSNSYYSVHSIQMFYKMFFTFAKMFIVDTTTLYKYFPHCNLSFHFQCDKWTRSKIEINLDSLFDRIAKSLMPKLKITLKINYS